MSSVYKLGKRWYVRFKDPDGKWTARSAADTKKEAEKVLREVERGVLEIQRNPPSPPAFELEVAKKLTFADCAAQWLNRPGRKRLRAWKWADIHGRIHMNPVLGALPMEEIRVRHIRDFMEQLRGKELAPRTIRKVYGTLHKSFADMLVDEVITHSPCVLTKDQLPKNRDKDPEWRATAIFSREELELLISSPAIPVDRRMVYALLFLTGSRFGEIAGLRCRDFDLTQRPLGRITIARSYDAASKTEQPRTVPLHPVLAEMLLEWRHSGFLELTGHLPQPDDLVVPSRLQVMRSVYTNRENLLKDLKRLGLRHRRTHDSTRTFITLARVDGARKDVLEQITHGARGNILDLYTTLPWPTLCEAVQCLKIRRLSEKECTEALAAIARASLTATEPDSDDSNGQSSSGGNEALVKEFVKGVDKKTAFVQKSWNKGRFFNQKCSEPNETISELFGRIGGGFEGDRHDDDGRIRSYLTMNPAAPPPLNIRL